MKLNAVAVTSRNMEQTAAFYSLLGFIFPEFDASTNHLEPIPERGDARLMIDSVGLISEIIGETPKPGNHSSFALEYSSPEEVDTTAQKVREAGYTVVQEPWDAVWGQRYAIVQDPDGYKVDLYAAL